MKWSALSALSALSPAGGAAQSPAARDPAASLPAALSATLPAISSILHASGVGDAGNVAMANVAGYHSRDPNATDADAPAASRELPDLGDDAPGAGTVGAVEPDALGSADPVPYLVDQNPDRPGVATLAREVLTRLEKRRVYVALPGETLPLGASPVDPRDVGRLLLETPSDPRHGSLLLGQARLFTVPAEPPDGTGEAGGTGRADAPEGETLGDLAEGWRRVVATRDASPVDCACREKTAPLIAEWERFRAAQAMPFKAGQRVQWWRVEPVACVAPPCMPGPGVVASTGTAKPGTLWARGGSFLVGPSGVIVFVDYGGGFPPTAWPAESLAKVGDGRIEDQQENLRKAQAAQSAAALLPPEGGDFVIDVRTAEEFRANPRPGAVNVPLGEDEDGDDFVVRVATEVPKGRRLVAFCKSGVRAARGCAMLRAAGWHACNGHDESCPIPDAPAAEDAAVSGIEEARAEVMAKSERQVNAETATAWADRAVASLERYAKTRAPEWLVRAANEAHEAVEHGAEGGDKSLARVRQTIRAAKVRLGLSGPEVDGLGWAWGENGSPIVVGPGRVRGSSDEDHERRVQAFAAAFDGVADRARRDGDLRARSEAPLARWRASLAGYQASAGVGLVDFAGHADDLGAIGVSDYQRTQIKSLRARASAHNDVVQQGRQNEGDEPELVEYALRWKAFAEQVKALDAKADSAFGWVTDGDLRVAEAQLNTLVKEWPLVKAKIELRRKGKILNVLDAASRGADGKPLPPLPPDQRSKTPIVIPDTTANLPPSTATTTPAPPPEEKAGTSAFTWAAAGAAALLLGKIALKAAVGAVVEEEEEMGS